jgi:hypothetical protein
MRNNNCGRYQKVVYPLLLLVLLSGCGSMSSTPINKIMENPRVYSGKQVMVSGEVTEIFSLFVIKYFLVRDKTGEIAVITDRPLPRKDVKIKVKGRVEEAFSIGDKQLIVIVESGEK